MSQHPRAGKTAEQSDLENIPRLVAAYYHSKPDPTIPEQAVSFGTSGHRGCSLDLSFNEDHVATMSQGVCDYRKKMGIHGPLFIGKDTHALSEPAFITAIEVFAANGISVYYDKDLAYTPTPVISHAILTYNASHPKKQADGIVITPSHNPPRDGGFKYNPPNGGPADGSITQQIQDKANEYLRAELQGVNGMPYQEAIKTDGINAYDFITPYVNDLENIIDMKAISDAGLKLGVDPLGGSGIHYWKPIAKKYGLDITLVNDKIDPTFSFMTLDKDGKIRMDCSSPFAMAGLIKLKDSYDLSFGNDPDYDRHGIVCKSHGLMNPNHYLAVAIQYLYQNRPNWPNNAKIGKTLVSSSMIDRVAKSLDRNINEVPVGFKWFVDGLYSSDIAFGGEESAGASFLRKDGTVWTTDKDGIILNLLAAEILAKTKKDPGEHYDILTQTYGKPLYERLDAPADEKQRTLLKNLNADSIKTKTLAGETITSILTHASGNNAAIGGIKVSSENGWFAARPSGTENIYKIYAESFKDREHLTQIQNDAKAMISEVFGS